MAAPNWNDRKLAGIVRSKLLKKCNAILDGDNEAEKKELLFKMCGTLLPRLQEITGADGKDLIPKQDVEYAINNLSESSTRSDTTSKE